MMCEVLDLRFSTLGSRYPWKLPRIFVCHSVLSLQLSLLPPYPVIAPAIYSGLLFTLFLSSLFLFPFHTSIPSFIDFPDHLFIHSTPLPLCVSFSSFFLSFLIHSFIHSFHLYLLNGFLSQSTYNHKKVDVSPDAIFNQM